MPFNGDEVFIRYAGFALLCALITAPFCGLAGPVGVCVALVFLRLFINRLP